MAKKKIEIRFVPGCFDSFEGTQEELDGLVAELQRMADSGELFDNSTPLEGEDAEEIFRALEQRKKPQ